MARTGKQRRPAAPILALVVVTIGGALFTQPVSAQEQSQESALIQAYQREFVFLDNEIRILQERLQEVESDGQARVAQAEAALEDLEAELLELSRRVDLRTEELRTVEDEAIEAEDADTTITNILTQAESRLSNYDVPRYAEAVESETNSADEESGTERLMNELTYAFDRSFEVLPSLGTIRTDDGTFFLEDGEQVSGTLVHIGGVASFGLSRDGGGTLAPAGSGALRLVDPDTADTAQTLADDPRAPAVLPIFLYESLDELVETSGAQGFRETIEGGGVIGLVILGIGVVVIILIVLRSVFLIGVGRKDDKRLSSLFDDVQENRLADALSKARAMPGAMGRVLTATIQGLQVDPENIEDVISEAVLNEQPTLDRFRSALSVFAAVAPLLGLLGTVTGMISTFDVITQYGTGDPKLLSGGISEALITTELGLTVAIPTLLIGNLLASWSDRITSDVEVSALKVVNIAGGYEGSKRA